MNLIIRNRSQGDFAQTFVTTLPVDLPSRMKRCTMHYCSVLCVLAVGRQSDSQAHKDPRLFSSEIILEVFQTM